MPQKSGKTNAEIYDAIMEIKNQLAERRHIDEMVVKHEEAIKGNGKPGLEQRVSLAEEREAKRDRREWFLSGVIVVQIVGFVVTMIS